MSSLGKEQRHLYNTKQQYQCQFIGGGKDKPQGDPDMFGKYRGTNKTDNLLPR